MKLPAHTPHKPAAAVGALLTILIALKVHTKLGISAEDLLTIITALGTLAATAFAYLPRKAES